ncbi:hypothetical protein K438DRAFT_1777307 [Mycena galopus ATCC 62051]|nr:hypothetical protein K438DRAFT_1777307 [Mycena galopus ATCC 62051]
MTQARFERDPAYSIPLSEKPDLPDQGLTKPDGLIRPDQLQWVQHISPGQGLSVSKSIEKKKVNGEMRTIEQKGAVGTVCMDTVIDNTRYKKEPTSEEDAFFRHLDLHDDKRARTIGHWVSFILSISIPFYNSAIAGPRVDFPAKRFQYFHKTKMFPPPSALRALSKDGINIEVLDLVYF